MCAGNTNRVDYTPKENKMSKTEKELLDFIKFIATQIDLGSNDNMMEIYNTYIENVIKGENSEN